MNWIKGQFIEIIEWPQEDDSVLLWKFPDEDHQIKQGAQLTVRETQHAVFVNEGQVADIYGPGRHELVTRNMPLLSDLKGWKYGFESPFKVEVYFINTKLFSNNKWGTRAPVRVYDPEFPSGVDMRAFGTFNFQVTDPGKFFRFAGNKNLFTTESILDHFRSMMVTEFSTTLKKSGKTLREIDMKANELGADLLPLMEDDFNEIGLTVRDFFVESVTLPPEIREELAAQDMELRKKRKSMSVENEMEMQNLMGKANLSQNIGDIDKFMKFQMGSSMDSPGGEGQGGSGDMSEMMKMMMSMGMANNMMQNMQGSMGGQQQAPQQQAPQQQAQAPAQDAGDSERDKVMATLKQLGELKEMGVLTEEEFNKKKADLLAKL
ncbi:MAG: SPFH domain-containing protein [Bacteroidota bacterium]